MPKPPDGPPADWAGFHAPRYTQIPDELFDVWLPHLSEAELKVLLYIMRHTFGWKKDRDAISLRQMAEGIVRRDGTRLDSGAGVALRSIQRALPELEAKRLITATRAIGPDGSPATTVYTVCMVGVADLATGYSQNDYTPPANLAPPPVADLATTRNTVQETTNKNGSPPILTGWLYMIAADTASELHLVGDVPGRVRAAWLTSGLDEAAMADRLYQARTVARKARGDKAAAYWRAVEAQG